MVIHCLIVGGTHLGQTNKHDMNDVPRFHRFVSMDNVQVNNKVLGIGY